MVVLERKPRYSDCKARVFVSVPYSFKIRALGDLLQGHGEGRRGKERTVSGEGTRLTEETCSPLSRWGHKKRKRF